jgi:hypothetical protein
MKFSILNTADNAYQFAVTENGKHSAVQGIPTLTEAFHLTSCRAQGSGRKDFWRSNWFISGTHRARD